jgi:hypothetical protein
MYGMEPASEQNWRRRVAAKELIVAAPDRDKGRIVQHTHTSSHGFMYIH